MEQRSASEPSWLSTLRTEGYVVVPGVLTQDEVVQARDLTWDWLESLGTGISRTDVSTWTNANWPGDKSSGLIASYGAGQSEAAWFVRGVERVKTAFAEIWGTQDLITSMDCPLLWRPWWLSESEQWKPLSFGTHLDQNIVDRPGFLCVQGMVPLLPVTEVIGGLKIVPLSHQVECQDKIRRNYPDMKGKRDFMIVEKSDLDREPVLITAGPGDLILWDSRMVHVGEAGPGEVPSGEEEPSLARCAYTVCMVPRTAASDEVLEKRKKAYHEGETLCHRPDQYAPHTKGAMTRVDNEDWVYKPIQLSAKQRMLL